MPVLKNPFIILLTFIMSTNGFCQDNLIKNGDFEMGDTLFTTSYYCCQGLSGGGSAVISDSLPAFTGNCNFSLSGNALMMDGAIIKDVPFWCQSVTIKPFKVYKLTYETASLTNCDFNLPIIQTLFNKKTCTINGIEIKNDCRIKAVEQYWLSGEDSLVDICLYDLNISGDCNDFLIDNISFIEVPIAQAEKVCIEDSLGLTFFNGSIKEAGILLKWGVSFEKNINRFEIKKAVDGNTFTKIGQVNSTGNKEDPFNYEFLDDTIYHKNYYRLKIIKNDSSYFYSEVILLSLPSFDVSFIYPNPAKDKFNFNIVSQDKSNVIIKLFDVLGRIHFSTNVIEINEGQQAFSLDVSNFSEGSYYLQVINTINNFYVSKQLVLKR